MLVEVVGVPSGELGGKPAVPERFEEHAAEIADSVATVAGRIRDRLAEKPELAEARRWGLDQVELTFQLALQVQGGVVIKATGGATFGVKLTWNTAGG